MHASHISGLTEQRIKTKKWTMQAKLGMFEVYKAVQMQQWIVNHKKGEESVVSCMCTALCKGKTWGKTWGNTL